jgi:hypothetical protein
MKGLIRSLILLVPCTCITIFAHAQDVFRSSADTSGKAARTAAIRQPPKGPKPITGEASFGYRLHTNGWSTYVDLGKVKSTNSKQADMFYNVTYLQLEFSEKKSNKQEKLTSEVNNGNGNPKYIYGKINNFYALKLGIGYRKMLAGKPDPGSVSIHWSNVISGSLGMQKPYYLNVYSDPNAIKYDEDSKTMFLAKSFITGSAGFGTGLSEIKMIPGGHFKSMLHFDFAANRKKVVGVETGISIDYYAEPVVLMVNQESKPYFIDLFMAFQFGKRW